MGKGRNFENQEDLNAFKNFELVEIPTFGGIWGRVMNEGLNTQISHWKRTWAVLPGTNEGTH